MDLSVVIPTCGRTVKLLNCLAGLARQGLARTAFEVIVGLDGGDTAQGASIRQVLHAHGLSGEAIVCDKRGPAFVRNRMIERARAQLLLLLNDDVVPDPSCLGAHLAEHRALASERRQAMVLGSAPWKVYEPDRLFDRLIRETSMIFFYDRMQGSPVPDRDWGFRHAWTLNLSLPKDAVIGAGWFSETLPSPRFEDIELAYRICSRGMPVLYRPHATVEHDHRYEPRQYLEREYLLGYDAWSLARANANCACSIFGRDIGSPEEIAYSKAFIEREKATATAMEERFLALADIPADAVQGPAGAELIRTVYQQHLLLKRYVWRQGLVAASEGVPARYRDLSQPGPADARDRATAPALPGPKPLPILSRP